MRAATRYWRIGTHGGISRHDYWPQMRATHDIAIGWPDLPELSRIVDDPARLREEVVKLRDRDPEYRATGHSEGSVRYICDQVAKFVRGITLGDIVVAALGDRVVGVGQVTGEYRFDPRADPNAPHRRHVNWLNLDDWVAPNPPGKQRPQGYRTTCWEITDPATIAAIVRRVPDGVSRTAA